jgi:hypothetical protein
MPADFLCEEVDFLDPRLSYDTPTTCIIFSRRRGSGHILYRAETRLTRMGSLAQRTRVLTLPSRTLIMYVIRWPIFLIFYTCIAKTNYLLTIARISMKAEGKKACTQVSRI